MHLNTPHEPKSNGYFYLPERTEAELVEEGEALGCAEAAFLCCVQVVLQEQPHLPIQILILVFSTHESLALPCLVLVCAFCIRTIIKSFRKNIIYISLYIYF